jgi:hypothetical protein
MSLDAGDGFEAFRAARSSRSGSAELARRICGEVALVVLEAGTGRVSAGWKRQYASLISLSART